MSSSHTWLQMSSRVLGRGVPDSSMSRLIMGRTLASDLKRTEDGLLKPCDSSMTTVGKGHRWSWSRWKKSTRSLTSSWLMNHRVGGVESSSSSS